MSQRQGKPTASFAERNSLLRCCWFCARVWFRLSVHAQELPEIRMLHENVLFAIEKPFCWPDVPEFVTAKIGINQLGTGTGDKRLKQNSAAHESLWERIHSYYRREQKAINENLGLIVALMAAAAAIWSGFEAHKARLDSAEIGRGILQTQIDAMQLDERPFLVAAASGWKLEAQRGLQSTVVQISLNARASGKTPAFDVAIREACVLDPNSFTHLPDFSLLEPSFQLSPILANHEESAMDCPVTRMPKDQGYIRAYGELLYSDLFKRKHTTTFCFVIEDDHTAVRQKGSLEPCFGFVPDFT